MTMTLERPAASGAPLVEVKGLRHVYGKGGGGGGLLCHRDSADAKAKEAGRHNWG